MSVGVTTDQKETNIRLIFGILSCCMWYPFYDFLNSTIRTCKLCFEVYENGKSPLKYVFMCLMCFGMFSCISCVFCCFGCLKVWEDSCKNYQAESTLWRPITYWSGLRISLLKKPLRENLRESLNERMDCFSFL
jgi:hypothetical protein